MTAESLDTSVAARLWYEGVAWTVVQIDGSTVLLHRPRLVLSPFRCQSGSIS